MSNGTSIEMADKQQITDIQEMASISILFEKKMQTIQACPLYTTPWY